MVKHTETHKLKTPITNLTSHPTYLWIGTHQELANQTILALQQRFCSKGGCSECVTCTQIKEKQHASLLWLTPEKQYTREQLKPIFHTISFALEPDQQFFFIIEKADYFNQACANSLLKVLEEPPTGYHFILLAQRIEYILPTIRSRCVVSNFGSMHEESFNEIAHWFITLNFPQPAIFLSTIDKANLSDRESLELLDKLFAHWSEQYTQEVAQNGSTNTKQIQHVLQILKKALETPPMPGSGKLFWKDLFLLITNSTLH